MATGVSHMIQTTPDLIQLEPFEDPDGFRSDRKLPAEPELEQALLGAILLDAACLVQVQQVCKPTDFYLERHAWIYEAMQEVVRDGVALDFLTLASQLEQTGLLGAIGGSSYLTQLLGTTATAAYAESYAQKVHTASVRRQLLQVSTEIAGLAFNAPDVALARAQALEKLIDIDTHAGRNRFQSAREILSARWPQLEERLRCPVLVVGISTGFGALDRLLGGYQKQSLVIVAGQPSMGKTSFLVSGAFNQLQLGLRVGFVSIEMPQQQIVDRFISYKSEIPAIHLLRGLRETAQGTWRGFTPDEQRTVRQAKDWLEAQPLFVNDHPAPTTGELRASLTEMIARWQVDVVYVDYINLVVGSRKQGQNRAQELGDTSRNLRAIWRDLDVPGIVSAQVAKSANNKETKRATMDDLRDSGEIAESTDVALFPFREDYQHRGEKGYSPTGKAEVWADKNRLTGMTGVVDLAFNPATGQFVNGG